MEPDFRFDEEAHVYILNGRRLWSVTDRLKGLGIIQTNHFTFEGRMRGKAAHLACRYVEEGGVDWNSVKATEKALGVPVEPYVLAWGLFLKETGWVSGSIEQPRYHPHYFYAGTPDRCGHFAGRGIKTIIDIKTCQYEPWHELQLGGYAEIVSFDGSYPDKIIVRLTIEGKYEIIPTRDVNAGKMFIAADRLHDWMIKGDIIKDERPNRAAAGASQE